MNDKLDEVYRQFGMLAAAAWSWSGVQVWATTPGADLLCCRWSRDAHYELLDVDKQQLRQLALYPTKPEQETDRGLWLPVRVRGLLVAALWLDTCTNPPWAMRPSDLLRQQFELGSMALTKLLESRCQQRLAKLLPTLEGLEQREQLRTVLRSGLNLVDCEEGNVTLLYPEDPKWLRLVVAEGPGRDSVFDLLPATFRPVQQLPVAACAIPESSNSGKQQFQSRPVATGEICIVHQQYSRHATSRLTKTDRIATVNRASRVERRRSCQRLRLADSRAAELSAARRARGVDDLVVSVIRFPHNDRSRPFASRKPPTSRALLQSGYLMIGMETSQAFLFLRSLTWRVPFARP